MKSSKNTFIILLSLTIFCSMVLAQQKRVVVHREIGNGDTINTEVKLDKNIRIEFSGDSLKNHIVWTDDGDFEFDPDSSFKKVFIHKPPMHKQMASRIIIKKSGFFRKSKIVIDFNPMTKAILKVLDNDTEVPENKFYKYQEYLEDVTELEPLEALNPAMEEFDLQLELGELPSLEGLAGLDSFIIKLEDMESKYAIAKKEHYMAVKKVVELDNLADQLQTIISNAGIIPPQKIKSMSIKNGQFFINGEEVKGDVGKKCIQAYMEHSDLEPYDFENKGDEISIHISFD